MFRYFHGRDDRVNSVCVWDVVLQRWTLLGSLCTEEGVSPYVYETENGLMKMASVDLNSLPRRMGETRPSTGKVQMEEVANGQGSQKAERFEDGKDRLS